MKFFITGATGFIGQHLCKRIVQRGHHIIALVRNPNKLQNLTLENIDILSGDFDSFCDPDFTIPPCDQVIHLAGNVTAQKIAHYNRDNYDAVTNLVSCLKRQSWQPKRFIFSSSLAATGPSENGLPISEANTPHPIDAYGKSKLKAENFLIKLTDFPVTIFRPPTVIGPLDTNVLNLFKIAKRGFGFIPRGMNQTLSYVAISDLVEAIHQLTQDASSENRIYFVAHNTPTDFKSLWREMGYTINRKVRLLTIPKSMLYLAMKTDTIFSQLFARKIVFDEKYYDQLKGKTWACSSDKIEKDFKWKAKIDLRQALQETADSYQRSGWI